MATETHIKIAYKMLQIRDNCRKLYADQWKAKQDEWRPIIQAVMKKHNCDEIAAGMIIAKQIQDEPYAVMVVLGTVAEILEPVKP